MKKHQERVKKGEIKPKKYVLVPIKAFGTIEARQRMSQDRNGEHDFLVMEHYETAPAPKWGSIEEFSQRQALSELDNHVYDPRIDYLRIPQADRDVLILGNTNPKAPEKGRWIFALPRDYD